MRTFLVFPHTFSVVFCVDGGKCALFPGIVYFLHLINIAARLQGLFACRSAGDGVPGCQVRRFSPLLASSHPSSSLKNRHIFQYSSKTVQGQKLPGKTLHSSAAAQGNFTLTAQMSVVQPHKVAVYSLFVVQ